MYISNEQKQEVLRLLEAGKPLLAKYQLILTVGKKQAALTIIDVFGNSTMRILSI